jgi:formate-dependent nitrite reductase cytochrome c552 subunit
MKVRNKTLVTLMTVCVVFATLALAFRADLPGRSVAGLYPISLVDTNFLLTNTVRKAYADLVRDKEDLSDFDCYVCHEKGKAPPLRFDTNQNLIIPKEHSDIVMHHGSHGRNNNCFNCHNETNLTLLQTRDGHEVTFITSQLLCGSCHGPTYRDWEAGAHGRTSGYWNNSEPPFRDRKICANCHDPHSPHFPGRQPAPGPHPLRVVVNGESETEPHH